MSDRETEFRKYVKSAGMTAEQVESMVKHFHSMRAEHEADKLVTTKMGAHKGKAVKSPKPFR